MTDDLREKQAHIADLRRRILEGEEIPPEELAEALESQRKAREAALLAASAKAKPAKRSPSAP